MNRELTIDGLTFRIRTDLEAPFAVEVCGLIDTFDTYTDALMWIFTVVQERSYVARF